MKKSFSLCIAVIIVAMISLAWGERIVMRSYLGPTTSTSLVTIASAGTGRYNCLSDVDVLSSAAYAFRVLDGGTTIYQLTQLTANQGLVRNWTEDTAMCGSAATAMYMSVSAGTYDINYRGFVR